MHSAKTQNEFSQEDINQMLEYRKLLRTGAKVSPEIHEWVTNMAYRYSIKAMDAVEEKYPYHPR